MLERRFSECILPIVLLTMLLFSGRDENKQLAEMADRAAERQAKQNQEMARQNQHLAEATKELVTADAKK